MHASTAVFTQILVQLSAGIGYVSTDTNENEQPPARTVRDDAQKTLAEKEKALKLATTGKDDSSRVQTQLDKTIKSLLEVYEPMAKETAALEKLVEERKTQAIRDEADKKAAEELAKRVAAMRAEADAMKATLAKLQAIQKESKESTELGTTDSNRLKREVKDALDQFFRVADPKMIADRYDVPLDANFSFDLTPEFLRRTKNEQPRDTRFRYGMGAEHTWTDSYWTIGGGPRGFYSIQLKSISQHEQVTTRIMYDVASELIGRVAPGAKVPVARMGLTVNAGHREDEKSAEAFKHIVGHPVDSFRPTVINNSTGSWYYMNKDDIFRKRADYFTQGEETKSVKMENGTITYGLPDVSMPIIGSSAGNSNWDAPPDPTYIKNMVPYHMNFGTAERPALKDSLLRDDNAPIRIESYSTQNSSVHASIERPRWNADGTPLETQYLNPDYKSRIEENLWRLAGFEKVPTAAELDDEKKYPPAMVAALKSDLDVYYALVQKNEGCSETGLNKNLRGTSFSAPTANGVLLAASILYPDASQAELIDAFCSSCEPITHRQLPDKSNVLQKFELLVKDDIQYIVDEKSGYMYSPMTGFGNFHMDPKADDKNPDSWLKMLKRLEAMKQEKLRLTGNGKRKTTVEVGEGANKREVVIDGQPTHITLELDHGKELHTKELEAHDKRIENEVMRAFRTLERNNDASIVIDDTYPIAKLIRAHKYDEALKALDTDPGILLSKSDPYYKAVEAAVKKAKEHEQHSYSFTVLDSQDACCMLSALRMQFRDKDQVDNYAVLEAPDGTRFPLRLSQSKDGVVITSTPGVMRKSTVGEWKLHTHHELDIRKTTLMLSGTERNKELGIMDVRELVLPKIELEEKRYASLPEKNIMAPITDPHEYLRKVHGPQAEEQYTPVKEVIAPTTREDFQKYLQEFLENSNLRKGGFIPDGKIQKVSKLDIPALDRLYAATAPGHDMDQLTQQLGNLLADANVLFDQGTTKHRLPPTIAPALRAMGIKQMVS